jgi:hypothetical protein
MGLRIEKREAQVGNGNSSFFRCENLSHADSKTAHWIGRVGFEGEAIAAARGLLWNYVRVEDGGSQKILLSNLQGRTCRCRCARRVNVWKIGSWGNSRREIR